MTEGTITREAGLSPQELQRAARDHLWLHFTRMGGYKEDELPIIVRGDGCYLEDSKGKRYLDALAGLFAVQIGYGYGEEMGEAAAAQMRELPFYTNWSYAHPRAIELAAEIASLAPGDLNRVFFVNGGSEAVESAWKLARQYYAARGDRQRAEVLRMEPGERIEQQLSTDRRWKAVARRIAYHGTTMGALSINGIASLRAPLRAARAGRRPRAQHEPLPPSPGGDGGAVHGVPARGPRGGDPPGRARDGRDGHLRARAERRRLVPSAGGLLPGRGEICTRYDILLCADEVITGFGRLGHWFGSERYDIKPDLITCAKGLSSAYAAIGAVIATDRVFEPFLEGTKMYSHGITFGGHPVQSAIALKNLEIMKRDRIVEHVAAKQDDFRQTLSQLLDLPIAGDLRGTGYFYALELVKDKETRETFSDDECETLLRGFLSPQLFERGLICRADDRGDPVVQISPPLVADQAEFDEITGILGDVLGEASKKL